MNARHRQRGQIMPLAMYGLIVLIGAVALVVDAGVFLVTQRQLQNAVDAAALAAVWYAPVCSSVLGSPPECSHSLPGLPAAAAWITPPCSTQADCVGDAVLQENLGYSGGLCRSLSRTVSHPTGGGLVHYQVAVTCDAPYSFARILPDMPASVQLFASAEAAVGYPTATDVSAAPPSGPAPALVSRIVN
jgi:hypothetical protein